MRVVNGIFSTFALSQGQRKRLALLVAYLEDRPCDVLDEWAADQDPVFKKRFCTEILRSLKASEKTVVVITHDEGYFDVADRCLRLEEGRIAEIPAGEFKSGGNVVRLIALVSRRGRILPGREEGVSSIVFRIEGYLEPLRQSAARQFVAFPRACPLARIPAMALCLRTGRRSRSSMAWNYRASKGASG